MIVTGSEIASFESEMADFWTKLANLRPKIAKNSHDGGKKLSYWQVDYVGVQNFCLGVKMAGLE